LAFESGSPESFRGTALQALREVGGLSITRHSGILVALRVDFEKTPEFGKFFEILEILRNCSKESQISRKAGSKFSQIFRNFSKFFQTVRNAVTGHSRVGGLWRGIGGRLRRGLREGPEFLVEGVPLSAQFGILAAELAWFSAGVSWGFAGGAGGTVGSLMG